MTDAQPPEPRSNGGRRSRPVGNAPPVVFVGGTGRSGTHVLARLLARHHRLFMIPVEVRFHVEERGFRGFDGSVSADSAAHARVLGRLSDRADARRSGSRPGASRRALEPRGGLRRRSSRSLPAALLRPAVVSTGEADPRPPDRSDWSSRAPTRSPPPPPWPGYFRRRSSSTWFATAGTPRHRAWLRRAG